MATKRKSTTGFNRVCQRPFDNYGVEFQHVGCQYWLGTYAMTTSSCGVYDIIMWSLGRMWSTSPRGDECVDPDSWGLLYYY
ncbi:hypothetical protein ZWY2020_038698 [Hordeum vulgare]|nr:hypothetical protein ZWY2020_038698 [Hordeum vulgare]